MEHGKLSTYNRQRCRCPPCRQANVAAQQRSKAKRWAEREIVNGRLTHPYCLHGKAISYQYYGCRCLKCCFAMAEVNKIRRAK